MIRAKVKGDVAREKRTLELADVESLLKKLLERVTGRNWSKCIAHVENKEKKMWNVEKSGKDKE